MSDGLKNREKESWNRFLSQKETFKRESNKPYSFGVLWTFVYRRNFEAILRLIGDVGKKAILDIGSGGGWLCEWFTQEGATSVGLDISIQFCRASKARTKRMRTAVDYVCADGENLPFKDNAFHASVVYQTLHHLPNPENAISEALRVSKIFVLGDEPAKLAVPYFLINIIKMLSHSSLHVGELSGIREKRFEPSKLLGKYGKKGYLVRYEKQWSIVPTFFSKNEKYSVVRLIYMIAYKLLMGIRPIRNAGHGLTMIIVKQQSKLTLSWRNSPKANRVLINRQNMSAL